MKKPQKKNNFLLLIQNAQLQAVSNILTNNLDHFDRKIRRWFSEKFSTPYRDTFNYPFEELLLHYYESNLEGRSQPDIYDMAVELIPGLSEAREKEDQEFADSLVDEQEMTLQRRAEALKRASGKLKKSIDKVQSLNKANVKPTSFNMNFDLDDEDDGGEKL